MVFCSSACQIHGVGDGHRFLSLRLERRQRAHDESTSSTRDVCPFADRHVYPHRYHVFAAIISSFCIAAINLSPLSLQGAHPRVSVDEDNSVGRPVGFELPHRCPNMRPELQLFFVCRVFTGSMRNQESRGNVGHCKHRPLLSVAPQYLRHRGPLKFRACRDSCNPTASTAASCIALSRSSTFPIINVPPSLDLLSLSSFG